MTAYFPGDRVITDGGGYYLDVDTPVPYGAAGTVTWGNHEVAPGGIPTIYRVELDVFPGEGDLSFYTSEILGKEAASMSTDTDWDDLAALAQAATPGPWEQCKTVWVMVEAGSRPIADAWTDADAEFIAAANPATILRLIDLVRELQRRSDTQDRVRERLTAERDEVEAKVRAQIAADIEVLRADAALPSPVSYRAARDDAARIAKGGA